MWSIDKVKLHKVLKGHDVPIKKKEQRTHYQNKCFTLSLNFHTLELIEYV